MGNQCLYCVPSTTAPPARQSKPPLVTNSQPVIRSRTSPRAKRAPPILSHTFTIRPHTSAYVRLRQLTSAYVSLRQHTAAYVILSHTFSIRHHTSVYVRIRQLTSAYVSLRQLTSAYVSLRLHTSAYVSIRQHTSAYVMLSHTFISGRMLPGCRTGLKLLVYEALSY